VSDEFSHNVAQKFPNTVTKEPIERPWDVAESRSISPLKRYAEEIKRDDLAERIDSLFGTPFLFDGAVCPGIRFEEGQSNS